MIFKDVFRDFGKPWTLERNTDTILTKEGEMGKTVKKIKQVCKCENCGNEAEMVITCSLPSSPEEKKEIAASPSAQVQPKKREKGVATCTHCGNEADMWVDL